MVSLLLSLLTEIVGRATIAIGQLEASLNPQWLNDHMQDTTRSLRLDSLLIALAQLTPPTESRWGESKLRARAAWRAPRELEVPVPATPHSPDFRLLSRIKQKMGRIRKAPDIGLGIS